MCCYEAYIAVNKTGMDISFLPDHCNALQMQFIFGGFIPNTDIKSAL